LRRRRTETHQSIEMIKLTHLKDDCLQNQDSGENKAHLISNLKRH